MEYVYFIQCGDNGPVKIGRAESPRTRLKQLQIGNPETLHLRAYGEGGPNLERLFHKAFASDNIHGEWFRMSDTMKETMEALGLPENCIETANYERVEALERQRKFRADADFA